MHKTKLTILFAVISLALFGMASAASAAPVRLNGRPAGELRGTTGDAVKLSLTTDESATCRYATSLGTAYASMVNTLTQTEYFGRFYHNKSIYNLTAGNSYTYYVRCSGSSGENVDDYVINFSVIADTALDIPSSIAVNSVTGTIGDGSLLTIQGSNFGNTGPSILLFDDFEGGSPGATIPITSPKVGSWSGAGSNPPTYATTALSGQYAMQIRDAIDMQQFNKTFPQPVQEAYISYWVRIPDGTNFPGAGGPGILPNTSVWKTIWIFNGPDGFGSPNNDLVFPTWAGTFALTGNDSHLVYVGNSFWTFSRFMRMSTWVKANGTDPLLPGDVRFKVFQDGIGLVRRMERSDLPLYDADDPTPADGDYYCTHGGNGTQWCQAGQPKQWDRITVPGWLLPNGDSRRPVTGDPAMEIPAYDDFYMATGPGAQARVEVCDNSTYAQCTKITIATPESWSSNTITARLRQGPFSDFNNKYLYVIDADGSVNANGYLLTTTDTTPPSAPQGLVVN